MKCSVSVTCTCNTYLEERPGTHCLRMHEIFRYIFRKKLRAPPCPYADDYTNQEYRAVFEIHSSNDLTYRTLLGYFSEVPVSVFQTQKGNKSLSLLARMTQSRVRCRIGYSTIIALFQFCYYSIMLALLLI